MKSILLASLLILSSATFAASESDIEIYKMAQSYLKGTHGKAKSPQIASKLFLDLAQKGFPMAQYMLGTLYLEGNGVKADLETATLWLYLAADKKFLPAIKKLSEIKERTSFQELDRANVAIAD